MKKIEIPATKTLVPVEHRLSNGQKLYYFPSTTTELVKIDLLNEAGSAYQSHPLVAAAANKLYTVASRQMDAPQISEFFDFRGIVVENNNTVLQSTTTFYTLSRHLDRLLPVLDGLVHQPAFPEREFDIYRRERKQKIMASQQKSSDMARRLFYEALFGAKHPLGVHATPDDADRLNLDEVKQHFARHYRPGDMTIVLGGHVDDRLLAALDNLFGHDTPTDPTAHLSPSLHPHSSLTPPSLPLTLHLPSSVQSTLRIGRILPLRWDDPDYACLMLLVTLLGGYFGSRLMSNLREDKGYTYGIYARTQLYRGVIVFYITADVAPGTVEDAQSQIMHELQRLVDEPVPAEELDLVRTVLVGDFLRSVDGIFERSARFCDMLGTHVTEQLTENLRTAIATATQAHLQYLAARYLAPQQMTVCRVGNL